MTKDAKQPGGFLVMIVKIALVALVVETIIMLGFFWFDIHLSDWKFALLDAGLLAILVAIIAFVVWLVFGPDPALAFAITSGVS